jgi:hypothetical protein
VVVVVLALLARKAIERDHDDEDDNGKTRAFLIVLVIVVVLALPARKAIDHDDEGSPSSDGMPHPSLPLGGRAKIALLDRVSVF